jgi:SEC-C motif-containing protein
MRSRWSAFALGHGAYLFDTLASTHPDRDASRDAAVRELSCVRERQRFLKLTVLVASPVVAGAGPNETGEVLFHARIFEKGQDRSFAELSHFVREDGAWRYASGVLVQADRLPEDLTGLDREQLLALATEE